MTMEKPSRVEVGQRWRIFDVEQIIARRVAAHDAWADSSGLLWTNDFLLQNDRATYLGGPEAHPMGMPAPMEEDEDGYPLNCLQCGKKVSDDDVKAWKAGARDFPRRTSESHPKPAKVEVGQRWRTYCGLDSPEYTWVVRVVQDGKVLFSRPGQEPRPGQKPSTTVEEVLSKYTYLGGSEAPPVGVPAEPDYFKSATEFKAPPTASRVSTPVLPRCEWKEQPEVGSHAYEACDNLVANNRVNLCEQHIFRRMQAWDTKEREARKEKPFQQSSCGRNGMLGIWSLRDQ